MCLFVRSYIVVINNTNTTNNNNNTNTTTNTTTTTTTTSSSSSSTMIMALPPPPPAMTSVRTGGAGAGVPGLQRRVGASAVRHADHSQNAAANQRCGPPRRPLLKRPRHSKPLQPSCLRKVWVVSAVRHFEHPCHSNSLPPLVFKTLAHLQCATWTFL